jgi:hypothetical protein
MESGLVSMDRILRGSIRKICDVDMVFISGQMVIHMRVSLRMI